MSMMISSAQRPWSSSIDSNQLIRLCIAYAYARLPVALSPHHSRLRQSSPGCNRARTQLTLTLSIAMIVLSSAENKGVSRLASSPARSSNCEPSTPTRLEKLVRCVGQEATSELNTTVYVAWCRAGNKEPHYLARRTIKRNPAAVSSPKSCSSLLHSPCTELSFVLTRPLLVFQNIRTLSCKHFGAYGVRSALRLAASSPLWIVSRFHLRLQCHRRPASSRITHPVQVRYLSVTGLPAERYLQHINTVATAVHHTKQ